MASIGTRTFAAGNKKYLSLAGEEYKRTISIGNNWTKIRIGILAAQNPNGTSDTASGSRLITAVCSGTAFGFGGGSSTVNCCGINHTGRGFGTNPWVLHYNANSGNPYFDGNGGVGPFKKVGATLTDFTGGSSVRNVIPTTTGSTQRKWPLYVQIEKGSPNYSFYQMTIPNTALSSDFTVSDFEAGLQAPTTTIVTGGFTFVTEGAFTGAVSESAGNFDTVEIYTNIVQAIEIYEFAAFKVA